MVTVMYNSSHPHDLVSRPFLILVIFSLQMQDDADITMINPSLLYDASDDQINTFIPIARRQQQANQGATASAKAVHSSSYQTPLNDRFDYGLIDRDRQEAAQQVEQILHQYHRELEQDSIPQMDCHRQLMTRLIDFLRPTYSSNRSKMDDLDLLFEKITTVYEKRQIEVQQRSEQLGQEICYLKKLILTSSPEDQQLERISERESSALSDGLWIVLG